jgi:hypothetical protein
MYNEDDEDCCFKWGKKKVIQEGHGLLPYPLGLI